MYCAKHNVATYRSPTCKVCELETLAKQIAELLQAYHNAQAACGYMSSTVVYETSIALQKANKYGLINSQ